MTPRRSAARLVAGLLAASSLTTCLPSEPTGPERVGFELVFQKPLRLPIGAVVTPLVRIIADGQELQNPRYHFESLGPSVVRVVDVESLDDTLGQDPVVKKGQLLQGLARGVAPVRVVYQTATGVADTTFSVQVVVSRIRVNGRTPADTMALPALRRLGDTVRLTAFAFDQNGGDVLGPLPFTWSSSDPAIATVAAGAGGTGLVTARNEGSTLITAKLDDSEGYISITVTQAAARVIVLPEVDTLRTLSRSLAYSFRALDSTNREMDGAKARWSSSAPVVARVDSSGVATAGHAGTALIIAQVGPAADTATLVVKQVVRYVSVDSPLDTLTAVGDTVRPVASATDSLDFFIPDPPPITWASADPTIATVDLTGLVTARRNGFVLIIASSAGQSGTATILVRQVVTRVQIAEESVALAGDGATVRLTAVGQDRNGFTVDTARVDWRTQLPFVATVDTLGLVTARGDGTTRITATVRNGQQSDTATVSVTGAPQQLIAFESYQGIEAIRADGTQRTVLLWNYTGNCYYYYGAEEYQTDAAWSPDGNHLAYTRSLYDCYYGTSDYEVYWARVDGTVLANLTNHPAIDVRPAWSPAGTEIAFTSTREVVGGCCMAGVYVMNADGSNVNRPSDVPGANPAWSPDGTRIAFELRRDFWAEYESEIYVVNAHGTGAINLTNNAAHDYQPAWSPDGAQVAFVSNRDNHNAAIWLMNPDGSDARKLTGSLLAAANEAFPAWSPDGSRIAFVNGQDLYVVNRDGTGLRLLAANAGRPAWRPVTPLQVSAGP